MKINNQNKLDTFISLLDTHILRELKKKDINEDKLISLTEIRSGFIEELNSVKRGENIRDMFDKEYIFSFNLSPISLNSDMADYLEKKVIENNLNPNNFILEIIETIGFKDIGESIILLKKLRDIGFRIAMDDFGMGYSSLSYITKLPLSIIKIDRYFISHYYDDEFDRLLIFAIRDVSKSLNLEIIIEGIETMDQLEFIKSIGAHYYQGYLHSKPMSFKLIAKHLKEGFKFLE